MVYYHPSRIGTFMAYSACLCRLNSEVGRTGVLSVVELRLLFVITHAIDTRLRVAVYYTRFALSLPSFSKVPFTAMFCRFFHIFTIACVTHRYVFFFVGCGTGGGVALQFPPKLRQGIRGSNARISWFDLQGGPDEYSLSEVHDRINPEDSFAQYPVLNRHVYQASDSRGRVNAVPLMERSVCIDGCGAVCQGKQRLLQSSL